MSLYVAPNGVTAPKVHRFEEKVRYRDICGAPRVAFPHSQNDAALALAANAKGNKVRSAYLDIDSTERPVIE